MNRGSILEEEHAANTYIFSGLAHFDSYYQYIFFHLSIIHIICLYTNQMDIHKKGGNGVDLKISLITMAIMKTRNKIRAGQGWTGQGAKKSRETKIKAEQGKGRAGANDGKIFLNYYYYYLFYYFYHYFILILLFCFARPLGILAMDLI
jgi:hypothetical protein